MRGGIARGGGQGGTRLPLSQSADDMFRTRRWDRRQLEAADAAMKNLRVKTKHNKISKKACGIGPSPADFVFKCEEGGTEVRQRPSGLSSSPLALLAHGARMVCKAGAHWMPTRREADGADSRHTRGAKGAGDTQPLRFGPWQ